MMMAKPLFTKLETGTAKLCSKTLQALQNLYRRHNNLNYGAYGHLIQHCIDHDLPRQAKQLHSRIILSSVIPDNFLASKLINFYSKINHLNQAQHVFDMIPQKNIFSFNALLIAYSTHNMYMDILRLFSFLVSSSWGEDDDVRPNEYTATCVLKALSLLFCDLRLAKEMHCFILRGGFSNDIFVVNGLITNYAKCDGLVLARRLFDKTPGKDIVSWNSMISGYSQGGFYEEAKTLYREMIDSFGLTPNGTTIVSVLQACGQSKDLILGMEVHQFIVEHQIEIDISVCNALIGVYAKCGSLDFARKIFEAMNENEKDEVTYNTLISGYMVHGFVDIAMNLFCEMKHPDLATWNAAISGLFQNNKYEEVLDLVREMQACGFRPNTVTLSIILPIFSSFSHLKGGKEIHAYAVRNNYDHNIYFATAIIDAYAKSGFLHGAKRAFDKFKQRSLILWTSIITAYAAHGDANAALLHFHDMLNNGIQPDNVTFLAVLTACAHSGMVDKAQSIFDTMLTEYGIQPSVEHYACFVGALSRAGRLSEAKEFISKMPLEPSAKVWGALLNGASVSGDAELGKLIFDRLLEIEPENTGNYILMANLYSQAGRWKEADMIREKMRNVGLKKTPGSSWI